MLTFFILVGMLASAAMAHPAVGIVRDSDGNIFYSDTANVWRIDPHGAKSIVVPNVHTHELWLDSAGNLYGEHLWYTGNATHKWAHRVWKLDRNGRLTDAIPARSGLREDYRDFFFARDHNGNMYWLEKTSSVIVFKRAPDGPVQTLAHLALSEPGWLSATPDGDVLIANGAALYRINAAGKVKVLSSTLSLSAERYAVMGAWKDGAGNIYAAVYGDSQVKKIDPAGHISVVSTSASSWAPTGGCSAPDGALWVLETSKANAQRVRHITSDGKEQIF